MPSYAKQVKIPGKSAQELYDFVSKEIERLLEKFSLGSAEVNRDAAKRQISVKSAMFSATLFCEEQNLRLDGKLSLMATPFRSKIDEGIDRWLSKNFQIS